MASKPTNGTGLTPEKERELDQKVHSLVSFLEEAMGVAPKKIEIVPRDGKPPFCKISPPDITRGG